MLTLVAFTRDGVVPLLGPRTSVGEFHHGAFYYFLLAPAAALSNGDPVAVTAFLALLGIGAVALTWWLARAIGGAEAGPLAGAVAGLLLAVSPAAIDESTFIWNPNPIAFFAVLALAAAWQARTVGSSGRGTLWWALALGAAGAVTQLHVLGVVFLIAILGLVPDRAATGSARRARARRRAPPDRGAVPPAAGLRAAERVPRDAIRPRLPARRRRAGRGWPRVRARVHAPPRRRLAAGRARHRRPERGRDPARGDGGPRGCRPAPGARGRGNRTSLARRNPRLEHGRPRRLRRHRSSEWWPGSRTTTTTPSSTRSS